MPILSLCGLPCSGKSTLLEKLLPALSERLGKEFPIQVVSDSELLGDSRVACFSAPAREKQFRGQLRSEALRRLAAQPRSLVILDASNDVKSFRYEIYCAAKSLGEAHAVLWLRDGDTEEENEAGCTRRNQAALSRYPADLLRELMMRFEEPREQQRWDSPLFRHQISVADVAPLAGEVAAWLRAGSSDTRPNRSTQQSAISFNSADFLARLDGVLTGLGDHLLACQAAGGPAATVHLPKQFRPAPGTPSPALQLGKPGRPPWTVHSVNRAKCAFINQAKVSPPRDRSSPALAAQFLRFLDNFHS